MPAFDPNTATLDDEHPEAPKGFDPSTAAPYKPRGAISEIANQLKAGVVSDLPMMAGQALQFGSDPGRPVYEAGKRISDIAKARGKEPDLQPEEDDHGMVVNALAGGARMLPQSMAPAALVGAGLAALPLSPALAVGGAAVLGSLPAAMSQGQQTLDKAQEAGVDPAVARDAARKTAAIEGLGETVGTVAGAKLFGLAGKPVSGAISRMLGRTAATPAAEALEGATSRSALRPWLHQLPESAVVETGTEIGQNAGEAYVEQQAGIDKQTPTEAGIQAIAPTLGMTALLAPFGLVGHVMQGSKLGRRADMLAAGDSKPEDRLQAAQEIQAVIAGADKEAAANFGQHAQAAIAAGQPLQIGPQLLEAPQPAPGAPALPAPGTTATGTEPADLLGRPGGADPLAQAMRGRPPVSSTGNTPADLFAAQSQDPLAARNPMERFFTGVEMPAGAPPAPAGPISRAAIVAPPADQLPQPEGEDGEPAKPAAPAAPVDPNAGPISRAAALAQQVANPAGAPPAASQAGAAQGQGEVTNQPATPQESSQAPAPRETPALRPPGDIVVDDHFEAAHQGATSPLNDRPAPSQAQKEAENYPVGRTRVAGLTVSIENGQGTERTGTDSDGKPWSTLMQDHYGRLLGTIGADSTPQKLQHVDAFIKAGTPKDWKGDPVVIDTMDPKTGKFDEHKVILGADDEADARAVFGRNYDDGQARIMSATQVPMPEFKAWAYDGTQKSEPFVQKTVGAPAAPGGNVPAAAPVSAGRQQAQADLHAALGDLGSLMGRPAEPAAAAAQPGSGSNTPVPETQGALPATGAPQGEAAAPLTGQQLIEQRRLQRRAPGSAGRQAQRSASYDANPLMTFLATHGLFHVKDQKDSLKSEFSPDAHVAVPGYHISMFRRDGKKLDMLLQPAKEEGYLPPDADERDLYDLIASAFRGNRIVPIYGEGQAEREMERQVALRQDAAQAEAEREVADFDDDTLLDLLHNLDDVPALDAPSSADLESAMRALQFSDEEIAHAVEAAAGPAKAPDAGQRRGEAGQAAPGEAEASPAGGDRQAGPEGDAQREVAPDSTAAAPPQGAGSQQASAALPPAAPAAPAQAEQTPKAPPEGGQEEGGVAAPAPSPAPKPGPAAAAAPTPAPQKARRTKTYEAVLKRLAAYFQPGAIVPSYGGHDRVIEFIPEDSRGSWSVKVHAVVKQGGTWVDDPKDNRDRLHSTRPSERELKAGPLVPPPAAAAAAAPEPAPKPGPAPQGEAKALPPEAPPVAPPTPPAAPSGPPVAPRREPSAEALRARADLQSALADLADLASQGGKKFVVPPEEHKLLPVLTRVLDAAFRLGYHTFKDAAKFALDTIREQLSPEIADGLNLQHLQGAYIAMSGGKAGADTIMAVAAVASKDDIEAHTARSQEENGDVPGGNADLERDSGQPADQPAAAPGVRGPGGRGAERGDGQPAARGGPGQRGGEGATGIPDGGPVAGGERVNIRVDGGSQPRGPADGDARADLDERGSGPGASGVQHEPAAGAPAAGSARPIPDEAQRRIAQRAAEGVTVKPGDRANIDETLPYLLPAQRDDVLKAEQQHGKPEGYGMLFTNGTGTGKTFTGLGVVKRRAMQGKTNQLIVVPDNKIAADWIDSGKALGLDITQLESTSTAGKGIVITTYANLGANDELAKRQWDHVLPDEAHSLMQSEDGRLTSYLHNLRAITYHPDGEHQAWIMRNRPQHDELASLSANIAGNNRIISSPDTMDAMVADLRAKNAAMQARANAISKDLGAKREAIAQEWAANQKDARTRATFLSATPFAYHTSLEWGQGYLFDYAENYPYQGQSRAYNQPDPRQHFFMTHLGYRMAYNKLTKPDASKIDIGMLERQVNSFLKRKGSLSGRMLEVEPDYDRRFVSIDSAVGNKIDEALSYLREQSNAEHQANKDLPADAPQTNGWSALESAIRGSFDHLTRRFLLEAIKAREAVPIVKQHLALGRRVVVFHDYKTGSGRNPFDIEASKAPEPGLDQYQGGDVGAANLASDTAKANAFNAARLQFRQQFPELFRELTQLEPPLDTFRKAFTEGKDLLVINGDERPRDVLARYKALQNDAGGPLVVLVQSDKNKGWSGHDTTGKFQRALINLGLPTAPTKLIQLEGRIYRTGVVSDAIMRSLNTGTNWERWAFAQTIASRASTAENLGMGELSRALRDSIIASFENADRFPPGHEGEGKGGKAMDRASNNVLSEFDRAKTYYWATGKKNQRTKAQEGKDYFATPEPLGLKMVQWADIRGGEDALEPSAGHGAIARWIPDLSNRTVIEPSPLLSARLAMSMNPEKDRIIEGTFEDHNTAANKYDAVVMNPPFREGGKQALEHVAKAAEHLRPGGRIVALLPAGPAADKRLEQFLHGQDTRPAQPLGNTARTGPYFAGDTVTLDGKPGRQYVIEGSGGAGVMLRPLAGGIPEGWRSHYLSGIVKAGPRTEQFSPSEGLQLVADIALPASTFERAGTQVASHVIVLEKTDADIGSTRKIDLTSAGDINALFDRIEDLSVRPRAKPMEEVAQQQDAVRPGAAPAAPGAAAAPAPTGERGAEPLVEHVTTKGKTLRGVVRMGISKEEARAIDPFTFKKDGGWFIREKNLQAPPEANEPAPEYPTPYETDLFGNVVPQVPDKPARAAPKKRSVIRQQALDLDGAPAAQTVAPATAPVSPDVAADLYVDSLLHQVTDREIGRGTVRNPMEAAVASRYLSRSPVERLDAYVTDKDGKVLGVVGAFKGDRASTGAHPFTVLAEALQIPGAANLWLSHNHPSGLAALSAADMNLERVFARTFAHTGIQVRGILAVTPTRFSFVGSNGLNTAETNELIVDIATATPATVPVYERQFTEDSKAGEPITSPAAARGAIEKLYAKSGPGILLLDAQNGVSGWIPVSKRLTQPLTMGDVMRQLLTAVTRSNASAAVLGHGGEFDKKVSGLPSTPPVWRNLVNAITQADVRVLDVIDVKKAQSMAETGASLSGGGELYALADRGTQPADLSFAEVREKVAEQLGMPVAQAQSIVNDLTKDWKGGIEVRVVPTARDLPGRDIGSGKTAARGMYANGVGYIVASMHKDREAIGRTLAHEVIQHHGLRATLGPDGWQRLMKQIQAAARAGNQDVLAAQAYVRRVYVNAEGTPRLREGGSLEADELAAHLIEQSVDAEGNMRPSLQWMKWVWAKVADFLRTAGLKVPFTLSELQGIWVEARRGLEQARTATSHADTVIAPREGEDAGALYALSDEQIVGNTGRDYSQAQERAMRNVGWVKDPVPLKERMQHLWANLGKTMTQGLVDQFAPIKDLSREAYGLLRLSKGASGAFEVMLQGGQLKLTDGAYDFDESKRGGVVKRLLIPLQGEHHDFLRWVAANRAEQLLSEDRERLFTGEDIRALKTLSEGELGFEFPLQHGPRAGQTTTSRAEAYSDSLATFNEFNKNTLDMAQESGLIDGESRSLWEKQFYVPFYRVADGDDGGVRGMNIKSGVVRQQAFKQLKGGTQHLNADLLENTLMNWAHLLDASAKNRAARATLQVLSDLGSAIESRETDVRSMASSINKRGNVVWMMDGGRKRFFLVDDPHLLAAVSALEFAGFRSPVMRAMSAFKHALTSGVTASPFFKVRNLLRDSLQSIASAPLSANPAQNIRQGWALTKPGTDSYYQLLAGGGTIHFGSMMEGSEARRVQALVDSGIDRATILDTGERVQAMYRKTIQPLMHAYTALGDRGEAVNRAALYQQLRDQGVPHADAALQARDLMDFSMQGSFTTVRFLTQVVPFMNARMQGLYKLGRAAKEDPARFSTVLGAVSLMSIALLAAYGDDDDWKKREDWDRNNYWWFKAGGMAYRIPKPFEIGAIATLAERSWEAMFDREMTGERFRQQVVALMGDQLSMNPLPQMVKPVLDVYANKDSFTGRPIETMGMEKLQPEYRFRGDTTMAARGASTVLNAAARPLGAEAPSPVQIDHMVRGYMGWLGSMVVSAGDTIARPLTGQPAQPQPDYWRALTGSMVANLEDEPSRYVSTTYTQAKQLEEIYGTWRNLIREGKMPEAQAFREEYSQELVRYRQVEAVKRVETRLNQLRHQVEESASTPEEKRLRMREINDQADRVARRLAPTGP